MITILVESSFNFNNAVQSLSRNHPVRPGLSIMRVLRCPRGGIRRLAHETAPQRMRERDGLYAVRPREVLSGHCLDPVLCRTPREFDARVRVRRQRQFGGAKNGKDDDI